MSDLNTTWRQYTTALNDYKETYQKWHKNRHTNIGTINDISTGLEEFGNNSSMVGRTSLTTGIAGLGVAVFGIVAAPFTGTLEQ